MPAGPELLLTALAALTQDPSQEPSDTSIDALQCRKHCSAESTARMRVVRYCRAVAAATPPPPPGAAAVFMSVFMALRRTAGEGEASDARRAKSHEKIVILLAKFIPIHGNNFVLSIFVPNLIFSTSFIPDFCFSVPESTQIFLDSF